MQWKVPRYSLSAVSDDDGNDDGNVYAVVHVVVGLACAYEGFALVTKCVPTLSAFCRRHRWFEVLMLGWLVLHLHHLRKASVFHEYPTSLLRLNVLCQSVLACRPSGCSGGTPGPISGMP